MIVNRGTAPSNPGEYGIWVDIIVSVPGSKKGQ